MNATGLSYDIGCDAFGIVTSLLPPPLALPYSRLEPFGLVILLALLVTGALGGILVPLVYNGVDVLATLLSLTP